MQNHVATSLPSMSMTQVASGSVLPSAPDMYNTAYLVDDRHVDHAASLAMHANPSSNSAGPSTTLLRPPPDNAMPTTAATLMREGPRDFTVIKDVGDGSFGTVCLADWKSPLPSGTMLSPMQHPTTRPEYIGKRLVAIKKMKKPFPNWQECMKLKELKSLLTISPHPNIIPLYDAFLMPTTKELHFVFECMEGNLYQLTKSRKGRPLAAGLVASIYEQIVLGLDHIHAHGYFHRDMKPENLLITTTGLADYPPLRSGSASEKDVLVIVKLADFGLARETLSEPPYTEYVSTRWYRAPEVLLRSRDYSNPVDMWALGTILAELVNLKPLFPGQSEVDQVLQICEVLGDPSHSYGRGPRGKPIGGGSWDRGIKMARSVGFQFPIHKPVTFSKLFSDRVPSSLVECIEDLLRYEPKQRLTSTDCLKHDYMLVDAPRLRPARPKPVVSATSPIRLQPAPAAMLSRAVPPSHSASAQENKPPFGGVADANLKPLASLRQPNGSMCFPNGTGPDQTSMSSPMQEDSLNGHRPSIGSIASAASFPQRAPYVPPNMQQQYSVPGARPANGYAGTDGLPSAHQQDQTGLQYGQYRQTNGAGRTVYDDDLTAAYSQAGASSAYPAMQQELRRASEGTRPYDHEATGESIAMGKRGSKGWGIFGGGTTAQQYPSLPNSASMTPSGSGTHLHPQAYGMPEPTPAQRIAAEHAKSSTQIAATSNKPPLDPKKAKKEAEKAAREAEKAKREAQQKAARDRARAVMQKRNQLLASSNGRDAVEWISGNVQLNESYQPNPSEKARGKLPVNAAAQSSPGMPGYAEFPRSPQTHSLSPEYGLAPHPSVSANMAWRGIGGNSRSTKARRREFDDDHSMSSFEEAVNPRRMSMQSYQTGDSDPGPVTGQHHPPSHHVQRASSSSSLASAPPITDPRRFAPSLESHRSSGETRSVNSLDHQLITNLENMTAAEARTRTPGNVSPAPAHSTSSRPSGSRQSRTNSRASSASVHRQGSASPLHHASGIPRFHPYSSGQPVPYHAPYQLPSLHQSVQQGAAPVRGQERLGSEDGVPPYGKFQAQGNQQHYINPIFNVPGGGEGATTHSLPPFAQMAAAVDDHSGGGVGMTAQPMLYAPPRSPAPMSQD